MRLLVQKITASAKLPTQAHATDAGYDLYADESVNLLPGQHALIKTGVKLAIPENHVGLVWDKSGLAGEGLHTLAGVIDAGYRGEILVNLVNLGQKEYRVVAGQKIAQILIQPLTEVVLEEGQVSEATERGAKGFGSSGLY